MKNLVIQHLGMPWPVGAIVDAAKAFPHGYAGHLAIRAVAETDKPVTHEIDLPTAPKNKDEAEKQNDQLRAELVAAQGRVSTLLAEKQAAEAELATLKAEFQAQTELLESVHHDLEAARVEINNLRNTGK
jgi:hypothetical protein